MDQIAALHFIHENIAYFGGDPTNVTLMGQGTGAACVHFLMTSSAVPEGVLFHRAIMMSGSASAPWALSHQPWRYARQLARHVNCSLEQSHAHLLKCLRDRPLEALLSTPLEAPQFATTFGPSIDGVVIDQGYDRPPNSPDGGTSHRSHGEWAGLRKSVAAKLSRYDLMVGVVKSEAFFSFTGEDVQYGIEADRRANILRTFVKNTYRYHLSEILATIVNEYTDWERPVQHPMNIRDETLEALSDAQYVAPVVHTADLHSAVNRNSYLYVFDYQTKFGDYQPKQGCVHGEEVAYVLGAPLVGGLAHFTRNYTKQELVLSEATMIYWSNFVKTGNPNEPQESEVSHVLRQERSRFKNIEWAPYEAVHKKYLSLDLKPKLKNHYRAHRLSFWLNLVPDLHRPGGEDVPSSHHQLHDSESPPHPVGGGTKKVPEGVVGAGPVTRVGPPSPQPEHNGSLPQPPIVVVAPSSSERGHDHNQDPDGFTAYSTALSATIAIGCSLLLLNALVFAGVYYRRDKRQGQEVGQPPPPTALPLKTRSENGGPMANIAVTGGATELLQIMERRGGGVVTEGGGGGTLPRAPPPPRCPPEAQPLLPQTATLGRRAKPPSDPLRV